MSTVEDRSVRTPIPDEFDITGALDDYAGALPAEALDTEEIHGLARLSAAQAIALSAILVVATVLIIYFVMRYNAPEPASTTIVVPGVGVIEGVSPGPTIVETEPVPPAPAQIQDELANIDAKVFKWRYPAGSYMDEPLLGRDGVVFSRSRMNNTLLAVKDGDLTWSHELGREIPENSLLCPNGSIMLLTDRLIALDGSSGNELWSYSLPPQQQAAFLAGPVLSNGNVLVLIRSHDQWKVGKYDFDSAYRAHLLCFAPDGRQLWDLKQDGWPREALASGPHGEIYFVNGAEQMRGDSLLCVSPSGKLRWTFSPERNDKESIEYIDIGPNGELIARSTEDLTYAGSVFRIDPKSGGEIWRSRIALNDKCKVSFNQAGLICWGRPDRKAYGEQNLYALDLSSGVERWSQPLKSELNREPLCGPDGRVYCYDIHSVRCFSPEGEALWEIDEPGMLWGDLLFAPKGMVYLMSQQDLRAIRPDGSQAFSLPLGPRIGNMTVDDEGICYGSIGQELVALKP